MLGYALSPFIKVPLDDVLEIADLLEDLSQMDVGEINDEKAHMLGSAQNWVAGLRSEASAQMRCPKHRWAGIPKVLVQKHFRDHTQYCALCGDLR